MKKFQTKKMVAQSIALLLASSCTQSALASDEEVIVVTASRMAQNINDSLAAVEVITRADIDKIQPQSLTDLLTTIAGFDFAHNGSAGQTSALFTRGTNSDHTLILINGIRVGSATSGTAAFTSIPVAQIERIEIVKGPRAALWGSDAIGGVIQIFTRQLSAGDLAIELVAGSNHHRGGNAVIGFGSDKMKNTITLSHENNDGYDVFDDSSDTFPDSEADNDGYRNLSAAIRGEYQLSDNLLLDWVAQINQGNNEFDGSYGGNESDYDNAFWNVRYSYSADKWLTQFSLSQSFDEVLSYGQHFNFATFELTSIPKANGSVFATRRDQFSLIEHFQLNDNFNFTGGIEWYRDDVSDSSRFIIDDFDPSFEFGNPDVSFSDTQTNTTSAFISSAMKFEKLMGELALRRDEAGDFEANNSFNLSIGYRILDNWILSASRAKGFKAPTFSELYYPATPFFVGNPDLKPEVSFNNELMIKGFWDRHSLMLLTFDNKVANLIGSAMDANFVSTPVNINRADLSGSELVYQYRGENLSHKLSSSYVRAKDLSIDPLTNLPRGKQLQRRASKHASYEITYDRDAFSMFAQFNYVGERPDVFYMSVPPYSALDVQLPSYTQINLGASYTLNKSWKFKLKINDVTDEAPVSVVGYNPAGQQVFVGVQYLNY